MKANEYRAERLKRNLTMEQLAALVGVHWTTISRRERGEAQISEEAARTIRALRSTGTLKTKGQTAPKNS